MAQRTPADAPVATVDPASGSAADEALRGPRPGVSASLRVAKRRIAVRIVLRDGSSRNGEFYSDIHRPDGTPATIVDRLNDARESYLPLAAADHHRVVRKSAIAAVELSVDHVPLPDVPGTRVLPVRIALETGSSIEGEIRAVVPPTHSRVLDFLNAAGESFLTLVRDDVVTLVNHAVIVDVVETGRPSER